MCGIIGYIGHKKAVPILINGLKRLEYRGYDSAGIATIQESQLHIQKQPGKISQLSDHLIHSNLEGTIGIGHTRWATHGEPNYVNAHPHCDCTGKISIIHNGIIENFMALRMELIEKGHRFKSDTDSEVLAHLIEEIYLRCGKLEEAVRIALAQVKGTYGIAVICSDLPRQIIGACKGSPLVVGIGENEHFLASDVCAIVDHTRNVTFLSDNELAIITKDDFIIKTIEDIYVEKKIEEIAFDLEKIEKGGHPHFMLKEITEQPQTIYDSMRGRLLAEEGTARLGGIQNDLDSLLYARRLLITACGTSWHAALIGEYMIEEFVRIPVEVEYASEFRYRDPIIHRDTVVIAISQSGETADTLAAVREAKQKKAKVLGICNAVGSSIARHTDAGIYLHAGPEIGVASTKAFTSQVTVLSLLTLLLSRMTIMSANKGREIAQELLRIPEKVRSILDHKDEIQQIARIYADCQNFLYLGRGYNFPVALEGALKLKEISYIHAEGYPAAEMKHGPIALIDQNMPVIFIATRDSTYDKIISNIEEVRARKGRVIVIATEGDDEIMLKADHVIYVPATMEFLTPLLTIIPLQLLAYYIAVIRGCDVDQPRNLAKSVTVE
ncbi:glutamine--fructose-6-phosphate transaminase (isomerizing) [candidate division KSB1 bacterium]|nr:glutamine--fructose-6-phosphate transaminase (isomerizing) [candidate division KSB1 bacterium]